MIRRNRTRKFESYDSPSFVRYLRRKRSVLQELIDSDDFRKLDEIAQDIDDALEKGDIELANKLRNNIPYLNDIQSLIYSVEDLGKMLDKSYKVYWDNVK